MPDSTSLSTAYGQALQNIQQGGNAKVPDYITAADTLNEANGNKSFLDSALDVVDAVPKFIGVSLISGANQIYNIPSDIGNLFGGDYERSVTQDVITGLDSNLGTFYAENQTGADLVGFAISSLIPGTAGIKMVNAGQKSLRVAMEGGRFGTGMGRAMGLLAPNKQKYIDLAIKEVANNSSAASLISANSLKAIGSGIAQGGIEALFFEMAVTATMFKSPILENQDFGDFVTNVALGAGIFGLVGGVVDATKISFSLKNAADAASIEARPWQFIDEYAPQTPSSSKIAFDFESASKIPDIPVGLDPSRKQFIKNAAETKLNTLHGRVRNEMGTLSGGDEELADTLFRTFKGEAPQAQHSALIGLAEANRVAQPSKLAKRTEVLQDKVAKGKATDKELKEFASNDVSVAYAKTWGEDAGVVLDNSPVITSITDTLKKGEKIVVDHRRVIAGSKKYAFDLTHTNQIFGRKVIGAAAPKAWNISKASPFEAQARTIWAANLAPFAPTAARKITIDVNDIPLMEKLYKDVATNADVLPNTVFTGLAKGELPPTADNLLDFLGDKKLQIATRMVSKLEPTIKTQQEIATIVNVRSSLLSGESLKSTGKYNADDVLAVQSHAEAYTKKMIEKGEWKANKGTIDIWQVPQHVKLTYNATPEGQIPFKGVNNFVVENMAIIKQQQKLYQEANDNAFATVLGNDAELFEEINSGRVYAGAVPSGSGPSLIAAASSNYGTLASTVENMGATTARVIEKFKDRTRDTLEPLLYKLGNNPEAAVEWSVLQGRVRSIEGEYGLNAAGDALEPLAILRWQAAAEEAVAAGKAAPDRPVLANPTMDPRIELRSPEVRALAKAHIEVNGTRTNHLATIRTAQGMEFGRSPDAFYPIPVDPKQYPHFAMVTDDSITSGNQSSTLFASSEAELQNAIAKLKENPQLTIRTKSEAEQYFKNRGQFDYEKTLSNNYLDTAVHRTGVSAPYIVATDPGKITSDMLKWHMQRETGVVREAVTTKYQVQFEELYRLGDEFTNVATSKFSSTSLDKFADDKAHNPFAGYIKTALAIKPTADYPITTALNKVVDQKFSQMYKKIDDVIASSKSSEDLDKINGLLKKAGYKGAAYDESMAIFANSEPASGALLAVVQKANSLMATVVLRWDAINAMNNAVSANVLLGAETAAVMRAIARGDTASAGKLADLTRVSVPGTGETIMTSGKMIAKAMKRFHDDPAQLEWYRERGYITTLSAQYRDAIDSLTFTGKEGVASWRNRVDGVRSKLRAAGDKGEKWTGNKIAEEFNRFVAADVMKQMTDIAIDAGVMTAKEQLSYINTFVNRTQGNYLAAQRPMMFHGAVGQAIGLFQTYQFNLMQQLLRHAGEGHAKDAMTLLGLQGTIHGMNGLPAFNAINTHVLGTASGNTEHQDSYNAVYGTLGKEGGDWLMYGAASNMLGLLHPDLKMNLYTRGDINPRQVTIVPTDPASVPIIQASGKVLKNLFDTAKTLGAGGDITQTLLQGLEHNSLSRPLAGLAQTLQGLDNPTRSSYSTSRKGNVIAANDLLSLANLGRIAGAKPLDEAVAIDAVYRYKAYAAADTKKRAVLGNAIKTTMIAGRDPTKEQMEEFIQKYTESGGRQEEFNKWAISLYKAANLSQANKIQQELKSPYAQSMQQLMGGEQLEDFTY